MKSDPPALSRPTRRDFVRSAALAAGSLAVADRVLAQDRIALPRPNILWIVSEDNNPFLGCYGNKLVHTPTLDRLARQGVLYENCFSQAPVCAPSRFTLITGMYATSCGPAHHMRAQGRIPKDLRAFPAYLRDAAYYCTNNAKTDYNAPINMKDTWDESSKKAHWRNRPKGKPFFAVFNHEVTHESQNFPQARGKYKPVANPVDPARIILPPYHPDTPEFRADWANYFDQMNRLDDQVAVLLAQLDEDALANDTIVFYYGDNGGVLPRSKRFCYDSGLHVPLIIRFPSKFQHLAPADPGSRIDAPVSFVDFAPTVLSLASRPIPAHMQGHPFAGSQKAPDPQYAFSFRNRMDERYDFVRTARDKRYRHIRNYHPHLIQGQHVTYMFQQASVQAWFRLHTQGKLVGPQKLFWQEKPQEELYDLQADPYEVNNLAASPDHQPVLQRMRDANDQHILRIRDNGFIPEGSPLEGHDTTRDAKAYPLQRILQVANLAIKRDAANLPSLIDSMTDQNECLRYWAALACAMLKDQCAPAAASLLARIENDPSPSVQVAAAHALCYTQHRDIALAKLASILLKNPNPRFRLQAANALETLGPLAKPALPALQQAATDADDYVQRATTYTTAVLQQPAPP